MNGNLIDHGGGAARVLEATGTATGLSHRLPETRLHPDDEAHLSVGLMARRSQPSPPDPGPVLIVLAHTIPSLRREHP